MTVDVVIGVLLGWAIAASLFAAARLVRPPRVISSERRAMQEALHAATATLPELRRGLSADSAAKTVGHLRTLTQAVAVAVTDGERVLAFDGGGSDHHARGDLVASVGGSGHDDRLHVSSQIRCAHPDCPLGAAVLAPLVVQGERVGSFVALFASGRRLSPDETRTVGEAASLVSAQLELAELEAQGERLARAELRAMRAQISPHFVYNALAAIASYIHSSPEEARELLTEFAEFTRYAFRGRSPYVTLADELGYVEKYLRLERARFGDRLEVRLQVAPEVLQTVVPVLSLQPLVENAVRHGVEQRGRGRIEIVGRDIDADVELRVSDDGVGMPPGRAAEILVGNGGGIGLINIQSRLHATFGPDYGLEIDSGIGRGTTVTMTVPKFRAGVRAA
ncbi:MAG TPA: histidine kinase [Solirubrobacteraceae bacterium]|nr:histidine kinase [Solirubrobacteraceae bacterium]